jgi:hypothetical protein
LLAKFRFALLRERRVLGGRETAKRGLGGNKMQTQSPSNVLRPLRIFIGGEDHHVRGLEDAIGFLHAHEADEVGEYAEMLLAQMEHARTPEMRARAWVAFETWSQAFGLSEQRYGAYSHAA